MAKISATFVSTDLHYNSENACFCKPHEREHVSLWRNDYCYVGVLISAKEDALVDVAVPRINGLDGEVFVLDATRAFIGNAGWYARNPKGIMPSGPKVDAYDILSPNRTISLKSGEGKCVLIRINSYDLAGSKAFNIDITSHDGKSITLSVDVDILPIDMPKTNEYAFKVEYWHHPYNVAEYYNVEPWSEEHLAILREHQLCYKAIGGCGVICTLLDEVWGGQTYSKNEIRYPSMIKWVYSHGKWSFDYTIFDKWVALNREIGLSDKFICYSMMPWGNRMRYYNDDKGKYVERVVPTAFKWYYKKCWRVFLEDFIRHLDALNIFESIYIGFDERSNMGMILDFLQHFTNKDGKHFKVAASFNNYLGNRKCLDMIDSVSVGIDEIKAHEVEYRAIARERAEAGKCTTLYTATDNFPNSFALSEPMESYWSVMYAYATGNNGFLRWAYDAWVADPLVDATHWSFQAGDCFLIYPNRESKIPSWSYRLMKLDEGVRDVNKLAFLAHNSQLAGGINEMLAKITSNYSYTDCYDSSWGVAIRHAKWIDKEGKIAMLADVANIKDAVNRLSREYLDENRE